MNEFAKRLSLDYAHRIDSNTATVGLILSPSQDLDQDELNLLLIKRSVRSDDPWSGHMAFPGGFSNRNETPLHTVIREVFEETGLQLSEAHHLGGLAPITTLREKKLHVGAEAFYYPRPVEVNQLTPCPDEVHTLYQISLNHFFAKENQTTRTWSRGDQEIELPAVRIYDQKFWGLSYMILRQFFSLCEGLETSVSQSGLGPFIPKNWPL